MILFSRYLLSEAVRCHDVLLMMLIRVEIMGMQAGLWHCFARIA